MNENNDEYGIETLSVHAGTAPDPTTGARITPIYQNTSYAFNSAEHAAKVFEREEPGHIYSRISNPTVETLENKLAELEGGVGAICTSSGLAAQQLILFTLLNSGDEFVAAEQLYGGSLGQFKNSFARSFGWKCKFADATDPENFERAITPQTKAIFFESLTNPGGIVVDIEKVARIAERAGVPLIVDNTLATPYLCKPFDYGANIITHSTTKFLGGHGNSLGGAVIDSGSFDWLKYADKFPALAKPEPAYHDQIFAEKYGKMALTIHGHAVGLRDLGCCQQPMNAFATLTGIETLPLRMQRHCENAQKVAEYLNNHPQISWVNYSGLKNSPHNALAQKYTKGTGGAVFTFGVKGGNEAGKKIVENVKLISHLANIGDTRTLIIHPGSTIYAKLTENEKIAAGVNTETIRISIGIESAKDIIADLDQAIARTIAPKHTARQPKPLI